MKKFLCLLLILSLLSGTAACSKNADKNNSSSKKTSSGYTSNQEGEYDKTVSDWQDEGESGGEFAENTDSGATPGSDTQKIELSDSSITPNNKTEANVIRRGFPTSALSNKDNLQFFYEGNAYAYGIDLSGNEYIAYKNVTGEMLDAVTGAGKYILNPKSGASIVVTGRVNKFSQAMKDGYPAITVDYNTTGTASYSSVQTTYIFKENCISVSSQINAETSNTISVSKSQFIRGFVNSYKDSEIKINSQWVYPADGDYPYPDFESLCYKHQLTDEVYMYSFMRGEGIPTMYALDNLDTDEMTLNFEDSKGLYYTHEYDLTFVDTAIENKQSSDYIALFKSLSSDFATGVAPVENTYDNSTVFVGNETKLNINVTNLTESDLKFSLRYDVRDYYGNVVDKGLFIDSTVYQYTGANRVIDIKGKYGIYYLNLYVISKYSTYYECYPFALIPEYTYKYNATSPFGINSANTKNDTETENTAKLFAKMGVANARVNSDMLYLAKQLHKNGITRLNGIAGSPFETAGGTETYVQDIDSVLSLLAPYIDSFEVGNEMNLLVMQNKVTMDELYPIFYKYTFDEIRKLINQKYPNIEYIPSPFSAGEQEWIDQLTLGYDVDTDGDGIKEHFPEVWTKLTTVSTHVYGTPWMPDEYSSYEPSYKTGLWCIEAALQRLEECFKKYCTDPNGKDLYITEVGYATSPGDPIKIDLRTHADYITRSGILCSAYGADRIQYYCMYDRTQGRSGFYNSEIEDETLTMDEYNFGMFYEADYYGRFMPKPAAIAFMVMTQQLESINKNTMHIYDKYDEGYDTNGVRAFQCSTALKGDVVIAYSNFEVLSNGKKNAVGKTGNRTPNLPWESQWKQVDETKFKATGEKVKVVDIMGNISYYTADNGYVTIPLTGSPVYIYGVK